MLRLKHTVSSGLLPIFRLRMDIARAGLSHNYWTSVGHGSSSSIRGFHTSIPKLHGHVHKAKPGEELHVTFITKDGKQIEVEAAAGDNLMDIAQAHGLDVEGACGGSCACSTCHMIVDPEFYDDIPEPSDDENDMLDLAFGLTETSRLGCQIHMTPELDGVRIALPAMTRNLQIKDFN